MEQTLPLREDIYLIICRAVSAAKSSSVHVPLHY